MVVILLLVLYLFTFMINFHDLNKEYVWLLQHFFSQMIVRLFDLMSGNSELEHPLCEECTESLLEKLDKEHQQYEEEFKLYKYLIMISKSFFLRFWSE